MKRVTRRTPEPVVEVGLAYVRHWARNNGFRIGDRGRISADIMAAFNARKSTPAVSAPAAPEKPVEAPRRRRRAPESPMVISTPSVLYRACLPSIGGTDCLHRTQVSAEHEIEKARAAGFDTSEAEVVAVRVNAA